MSALGYGKRTDLEEYPLQGRGGGGVATLKRSEKTGDLVAAHVVAEADDDDPIIISSDGIVIRQPVKTVPQYGRPTQGVHLMNMREGD